jgi:S-formylglutathione hydrolase FrmB
MWANRAPFRQPFVETADAVFAAGTPGRVLVYIDAWTTFGGSQFVDSPGTGRYHSYLCEEIVPWVDEHYRTIPHRDSRAIAGKSSGGFGAMITPMLRPDLFGALATHAGDTQYELTYISGFGAAARALRDYDHDIMRWWADFRSRPAFIKPVDETLLEVLCLSACFSAREDGTPELPFDPVSGALMPEQWQRWLNWDPVRMVGRHLDEVRSLRAVWIDAGTRDEWYLDLGAEAFRAQLAKAGLPDDRIHFELFDAGHGGIDYRYPLSLAWLAERLAR